MFELNGRLLVATSGYTLDQPTYLVIDLLYPLKIFTSTRVLTTLRRILLPEDNLRSLLLFMSELRLTRHPLPVGLMPIPTIAIGIHLGQLEVVAFGEGRLPVLDETAPAEGLREGLTTLWF